MKCLKPAMRKLVELRAGDEIPEGAKLISKRYVRGRIIDCSVTIIPGRIPLFSSDIQRTELVYEQVPVFTYEVEISDGVSK